MTEQEQEKEEIKVLKLEQALKYADSPQIDLCEYERNWTRGAVVQSLYYADEMCKTLAAAVRELRETVKAREEEISRLMPLLVKTKRFKGGDCPICGYNGPGYFQPDTHPCARYYHDPVNPSLDEALNRGDGVYRP